MTTSPEDACACAQSLRARRTAFDDRVADMLEEFAGMLLDRTADSSVDRIVEGWKQGRLKAAESAKVFEQMQKCTADQISAIFQILNPEQKDRTG